MDSGLGPKLPNDVRLRNETGGDEEQAEHHAEANEKRETAGPGAPLRSVQGMPPRFRGCDGPHRRDNVGLLNHMKEVGGLGPVGQRFLRGPSPPELVERPPYAWTGAGPRSEGQNTPLANA